MNKTEDGDSSWDLKGPSWAPQPPTFSLQSCSMSTVPHCSGAANPWSSGPVSWEIEVPRTFPKAQELCPKLWLLGGPWDRNSSAPQMSWLLVLSLQHPSFLMKLPQLRVNRPSLRWHHRLPPPSCWQQPPFPSLAPAAPLALRPLPSLAPAQLPVTCPALHCHPWGRIKTAC